MLKIEGINEYNGFILEHTITFDQNIIVLTGKNGSGKTRLLESIKKGYSTPYINEETIKTDNIIIIPQANMIPDLGDNYNDIKYQETKTATIRLFEEVKFGLDDPDYHYNVPVRLDDSISPLDYQSLYMLCNFIANRLNKKPSELTHEEINLFFEIPSPKIFGFQNISLIMNQYIKRLHDNEKNEWKSTSKNTPTTYLSNSEFISTFGERPWNILNEIIRDTFDGKYRFNLPDESSLVYRYQAQLMDTKNDKPVSLSHLSSGEKTLLWLSITLFNSQYYNSMIVTTPKILLIDEPDAFLHPKMVLKMYSAIQSFIDKFKTIVIMTTHSPTTVALSPYEYIYLVENNKIEKIDKDKAIADLLDGVNQISINPKNRRQIFVESQYDADVYQLIYSKLSYLSDKINPAISLNFISSGPKMPAEHLTNKVKQILKINDETLIDEFIKSVNGAGDCDKVIAQVNALTENEHDTVRGVIDWDLKNEETEFVKVLAKGYAYSIENVTLDPICILLLLHMTYPDEFKMEDICGVHTHWTEWINDQALLQEAVDRFILNVIGKENNKRGVLRYISKVELQTDTEYLEMHGHTLEKIVKEKYARLKSFYRKGKDGELKYNIVMKSMITYTNNKFIPSVYEDILYKLQS